MRKLVDFPLAAGGNVRAEIVTSDEAGGTATVGRGSQVVEAASEAFEVALRKIEGITQTVVDTLGNLTGKMDEVQVQFGFKLNAQLGVILAGTSAEANLQITLKWKPSLLSTSGK